MTTVNQLASLFSTGHIAKIQMKNRIGLAPMTRTSATETGEATDTMMRYYAKFARGGFAFLITEGTYPDESYSQGYLNQPGISNSKHTEAWKKVVQAVHKEGASIFMQLMHAGSQAQGNRFRPESIAPSPVQPKGEKLSIYGGEGPFAVPREMTKADIADVVRGFGEAANRAKEAGFDGVEIHGANGYLLDEFLTDYMNQRTDEYGGSAENRVRVLVEVVMEVRKAVGKDYVVGIRISQGKVSDYHHKWAGAEKDAEIIFSRVSGAGVDYIHVTEYDAEAPAFEGTNLTLAALAKKYGTVPVIANGNLEQPEKAEAFLASGQADFITLGKGALANQDYVQRVKEGKPLKEFDFGLLQPRANVKEQEQ